MQSQETDPGGRDFQHPPFILPIKDRAEGIFDNSESDRHSYLAQAAPVVEEVKHLAEHPPGGDVMWAAHYQAVDMLIQEAHPYAVMLAQAYMRREAWGTSPRHVPRLSPPAWQHSMLWKDPITLSNEHLRVAQGWRDYIAGVFERAESERQTFLEYAKNMEREGTPKLSRPETQHFERVLGLGEILNTHYVNTTVPQRYAGLKSAGTALLGGDLMSVFDIGCGILDGDRVIAGVAQGVEGVQFGSIEDHTRDMRFTKALVKPIEFRAMGLDAQNANTLGVRQWEESCHRPKELTMEKRLARVSFQQKLAQVRDVAFIQGDAMRLLDLVDQGIMHPKQFNLLSGFTFLYQYTEEGRRMFMDQIRAFGLPFLCQDFAVIDEQDPTMLRYHDIEWYPNPDDVRADPQKNAPYRTFVWEPGEGVWLEALIWDSGRCKEVWEGKDFDRIFSL